MKPIFRSFKALIVVATVASAGLGPSAAAEEGRFAEARRLFEQGVELFGQENYPAALATFEASYALRESPVVLFNIAMCRRALFRFPEAIDSFETYLQRWGEGLDPEQRAEVDALLAEMRARLFYLTVGASVDGAEVLVDGQRVGQVPLAGPVRLGPGEHVIEARAPQHEPVRERITVTGPGSRTLELTLRRQERPGRVRITADAEGARLRLDGEDRGSLPAELELAPGTYTIEVSAPGFTARREPIEVAAGENRSLELHLEPEAEPPPAEPPGRPWYRTWWFWTAVGLVVAGGVVAGAVAGTAERDWGTWDVRLP